MNNNQIQQLAEYAGAGRAVAIADNEVTSFRLRVDGGATITLASGEVLRTSCSDDVPPLVEAEHRARTTELLTVMVSLVPGKLVRAGVTYHRRLVAVGEGQVSAIFVEAGR